MPKSFSPRRPVKLRCGGRERKIIGRCETKNSRRGNSYSTPPIPLQGALNSGEKGKKISISPFSTLGSSGMGKRKERRERRYNFIRIKPSSQDLFLFLLRPTYPTRQTASRTHFISPRFLPFSLPDDDDDDDAPQ